MAVQMLLHIEPESQLWPRDKKKRDTGRRRRGEGGKTVGWWFKERRGGMMLEGICKVRGCIKWKKIHMKGGRGKKTKSCWVQRVGDAVKTLLESWESALFQSFINKHPHFLFHSSVLTDFALTSDLNSHSFIIFYNTGGKKLLWLFPCLIPWDVVINGNECYVTLLHIISI